MSTMADDLARLLAGVQKVAKGARDVEQAAAQGLERTSAVVDHLTRSETVDRIVEGCVGALLRGVVEEAQAAPSHRPPSPPPVEPQPARTSARQHPRGR